MEKQTTLKTKDFVLPFLWIVALKKNFIMDYMMNSTEGKNRSIAFIKPEDFRILLSYNSGISQQGIVWNGD